MLDGLWRVVEIPTNTAFVHFRNNSTASAVSISPRLPRPQRRHLRRPCMPRRDGDVHCRQEKRQCQSTIQKPSGFRLFSKHRRQVVHACQSVRMLFAWCQWDMTLAHAAFCGSWRTIVSTIFQAGLPFAMPNTSSGCLVKSILLTISTERKRLHTRYYARNA
jgi:hypothetical protein